MRLATPAIWFPGQDDAEWQEELDAMIARSRLTSAFLQGHIDPDYFLDYLAQEYDDPLEVAEEWESWEQPGIFSR
jgi:hypothetical protein